MRTPIRPAVLLAALLLVSAAPGAHAKSKCGGSFKKTCLKSLFKCFDAKGACTQQTKQPQIIVDPDTFEIRYIGNYESTTCWANGTREVYSFDPSTSMGTLAVTTSKRKSCLSGTVSGSDVRYARKGKTWVIHSAQDGSFTVTCPNGKTEVHPAVDTTSASTRCGGTGGVTCTAGTCP